MDALYKIFHEVREMAEGLSAWRFIVLCATAITMTAFFCLPSILTALAPLVK